MGINNMSDEELDNLFRKSAENYDPPFDEEAWTAMDRKLDGRQGLLASLKRYFPGLLLVLLVSVGIIWKIAEEPDTGIEKVAVSENRKESQAVIGATKPEKAEQTENAVLPEPEARTIQHPVARASGSGKAPHANQRNTSNPLKKSSPIPAKPEVTVAGQAKTAEPKLVLYQPPVFVADEEKPKDAVVYSAERKEEIAAYDTTAQVLQKETAPVTVPDSSSQENGTKQQVFLKSITLALVVAPDLTTVRFKDPDAVSANAGLLVSLPLTKRFSLVSGAIWANKLYKASAEDYEPYPDYWNGKPVPDVITAKCKVLDIPVNLQYKVLERGKNMLSVQAGLSSYIMLNEKYTYTYTHHGNDPYSKTKEYANQNKHWFTVHNLSVGYTRKLSPVFSIGVEPFVKIPLSSIGAGHVKLTSAGVFFTAGFTLHQKN